MDEIKLKFNENDIKTFAECFGIVHHSRGRVRLRANERLIALLAKCGAQRLESLLESAKALPIVKSLKINKLIGSVTIEYDSNAFDEGLWELWLVEKDSAAMFEKLQELIKA